MTRDEILENLCWYDERYPAKRTPSLLQQESKVCWCPNCAKGKTKLAVAMLEMICCGNCKHYNPNSNYPPVNCRICNFGSDWELKK